MTYQAIYEEIAPDSSTLSTQRGLYLLEFGTNWCGHCKAAQTPIAEVLGDVPDLPHCKVEDGPGRTLGRRFRVKLWPTLILLNDGQEIGRLVRPTNAQEVRDLLAPVPRAV
jgi:thioredoxin 1